MLTEDYCSFEVAKLLKEKGFDVYTPTRYDYDGGFHSHSDYLIGDSDISAPTHQMAMKYLRKEHNIGIFPSSYTFMDGEGTEKYHPYGTSIVNLVTHNLMTDDIMPRNSYEEAVEAALKYSLENLI